MTSLFLSKSTIRRPMAVSVACLMAFAAPAYADLSATDVWGQWKEYYTKSGLEISAKETLSGGVLTVRDITFSMPLREAEKDYGTLEIVLGEMTLADQSDGSVAISTPLQTAMSFAFSAKGEDTVKGLLDYTSSGFSMTATGTPNDVTYAYSADTMIIALEKVLKGGDPLDVGTAKIALSAFNGGAHVITGMQTRVDGTSNIGSAEYVVDFHDPENPTKGTLKMAGAMRGIVAQSATVIPDGVDMNDFSAALKAGYSVSAGLTYQGGNSDIRFKDRNDMFEMQTSSAGGNLKVGVDLDRVQYDVASQTVAIKMAGSELPFPLDLSADTVGMALSLPLTAKDTTQDFGASITMNGVALPEQIWAMGDPSGMLAREPLTIAAAISGTGKLLIDLTDEKQMMKLGQTGGLPAMIESVKLESLKIKGAGAEITATADLKVDNAAMSPLGPFPNVFGVADLRLMGVKALIETLTKMGIVPMGQGMMVSGMASELGVEVTGPDDLAAKITMTEQGMFDVNGKPIPLK
ncbi:MAG: hypothetical protein ACRBBU_08530 [Pseudooceanicola sp.]